ncbi:MAG: hypothetical protein LH619_01470, partial [Chitinophagaceae bacterium]|nr:hypothetical protein [Chitinophagaceae bacterium]
SVYTSKVKLVHDATDKNFTLDDRMKQFKTATDLYKLHEQLAMVVDTINARQKLIKETIGKVQDSSLARTMRTYNDELEKLRSELLATKQKSVFADEKKLREEITEAYSSVTGQEAAPSNLAIQRAAVLQQEVKKKEEANKQIMNKFDKTVNEGLRKEGLLPGQKKGF